MCASATSAGSMENIYPWEYLVFSFLEIQICRQGLETPEAQVDIGGIYSEVKTAAVFYMLLNPDCVLHMICQVTFPKSRGQSNAKFQETNWGIAAEKFSPDKLVTARPTSTSGRRILDVNIFINKNMGDELCRYVDRYP